MNKRRVLILCTGNSARSQMAEGLLRHDAGDGYEVFSAGVDPAARVQPEAVTVMRELGIDLAGHRPKHVEEYAGEHFDYVLTVCDHARELCPAYPATTETIHHSFIDPVLSSGTDQERLARFRKVRDEIREYLRSFPERKGGNR